MNIQDKLQPPSTAHQMIYRVPYSETDAMGRVYYAHYLTWFERARTEMLRAAGFTYRQMEAIGVYLPVRECAVRYLGFGEYDDEIELITWITSLRRARVEIATLARKQGKPITVGAVELVCVGADGKPREFPATIAEVLQRYAATQVC
jgi:acyl-CoA thioester hydrolase